MGSLHYPLLLTTPNLMSFTGFVVLAIYLTALSTFSADHLTTYLVLLQFLFLFVAKDDDCFFTAIFTTALIVAVFSHLSEGSGGG